MQYTNLIPYTISFLSLLIAFVTLMRNGKKDEKTDMKEEEARLDGIKEGVLKANIKLDSVCATTNETRMDIKALNKDLSAIDKRVTAIERDVKTAFNEIAELKERIGGA